MITNYMLALYFFSCGASLAMLVMGIFARSAPKSLFFTLLTLSIFLMNLGFVLEVTAPTLAAGIVAVQIQYLGAPFVAPLAFLFICSFCGLNLRKIVVFLIFVIPIVIFFLAFTWPINGVFYVSLELMIDPMLSYLVVNGSEFHLVFQVYNAILPIAADVILIYHFFKRDAIFRRQALAIVAATILPLVGIVSIIFGIGGPYDLTPIYLGIACLLLSYSVLRLGLYRVAPIAREQIVESMSDGFIILDTHGKFIDANIAAKRILPKLATISQGMSISGISEIAWFSESEAVRGNEFSVTGRDGNEKHYRLSETEVRHSHRLIGRCVMIYDITEAKRLLNEVSFLAERDTLTGLINRRTLYNNGEQLFRNISKKGGSACMLMLDIDHFKKINDTYGHMMGDEVLKALANVMSTRFRDMEIARYGGEEFCAFMPDIPEDTVLEIAKTMRERIEKLEFVSDGKVFNVTISIGLSFYDAGRHNSFDMMFSDADAALYAAKNGGRNTIYIARVESDNLVLECALDNEA